MTVPGAVVTGATGAAAIDQPEIGLIRPAGAKSGLAPSKTRRRERPSCATRWHGLIVIQTLALMPFGTGGISPFFPGHGSIPAAIS